MDGDGFVDPRKRSQRGRGRGGRVRARGKGSRGRGQLTGRGTAPSTVLTNDQESKREAPTNAFRFEKYDALRAAARREGITDANFHGELSGQDDNRSNSSDEVNSKNGDSDFDADVARRTAVDSFVADAKSDNDETDDNAAYALLQDTLAADFSGLARVLDTAPLWARLGDAALFALGADGANLNSLVEDDSGLHKSPHNSDIATQHLRKIDQGSENNLEREINTDVAEMMRDLDLLNQEDQKNEMSNSLHDDIERRVTEDDDDGFDRWLDGV